MLFLAGELAKLDMLHEAIVHKCIKQVTVLIVLFVSPIINIVLDAFKRQL